MSGRKRVTVSVDQEDLRRLRRSESELRRIRSDVPNLIRDINRDFQSRIRPLEERQNRFESSVSNLQADVRKYERDTAKRLQEQQRKMYQELEQQEKRFNKEIHSLAQKTERMMQEERCMREEQIRQVSAAIEEESRVRQQQVNRLAGEIQQVRDDIQAKEVYRKEVAETWIEAAQTIHDFIKANYRHEHFAPGRVADLERSIQQARQNVKLHLHEPAISQAQDAYRQLSDLRLELEQLEQEWQMWLNAALGSSRELFEQAKTNRHCKALDMDGNVEHDEQGREVDIEVDFWSNGRLSALEQKLAAQIQQLEQDDALTTEAFRQIVEQTNPELQQELEQLVYEARVAVISSQLRFSIADMVVEKLAEQGFDALDDETYEGEDMRSGYVAKVKNLRGDEVVIRVVPKTENPTENELQLHSYDATQRSAEELQQRTRELKAKLQESGLQAGEAEEFAGGQPDPIYRNIDAVRKMQATQQQKTA